MSRFYFKGSLPASKSMLNRALVALSYEPSVKILGDSSCEDVRLMRQGLADLIWGKPVECGHAGTVLRFLALRASRLHGSHVLQGSERLFSRPQSELMPILGQLGVTAVFDNNSLRIKTDGWRLIVDGLHVNAQRSSQFASAVILNAWGLKFPLHFHIPREIVSESYLKMTVQMMRQMGMRIETNGSDFFIPANQKIGVREYVVEMDLSSAFAVAAMAVVGGEAHLEGFPEKSLQPDAVFLDLLTKMGASLKLERGTLHVQKSPHLQGVKANLINTPDLFPILSVLCALANSPSELSGVGHLKYKESSRLERTSELLSLMGAKVQATEDFVRIEPASSKNVPISTVVFNVDQDHRMAMAATVARWAGYPIQVSDMKVVDKSFPEFAALASPTEVGAHP